VLLSLVLLQVSCVDSTYGSIFIQLFVVGPEKRSRPRPRVRIGRSRSSNDPRSMILVPIGGFGGRVGPKGTGERNE